MKHVLWLDNGWGKLLMHSRLNNIFKFKLIKGILYCVVNIILCQCEKAIRKIEMRKIGAPNVCFKLLNQCVVQDTKCTKIA